MLRHRGRAARKRPMNPALPPANLVYRSARRSNSASDMGLPVLADSTVDRRTDAKRMLVSCGFRLLLIELTGAEQVGKGVEKISARACVER